MAYTTINKSTDYFRTKLYAGNASNRSITFDESTNMQPDLVWIKSRTNAEWHHWVDAVRGTTSNIYSNATNSADTDNDRVTAFGTNGFSLGVDDGVNNASETFVAWNWKANGAGSSNSDGSITSTVSVNTTAGFSIVKFTGTGANATVGHGLGVAPKWIIFKDTTNTKDWFVYHQSISPATGQKLNSTANPSADSGYFNNTATTSSVFSVGNGNTTNASSATMIAYCFAEKTGYSKFGSYVGNGNVDGTFIYTGFKPSLIIIKKTSATQSWTIQDNKRNPINNGGDMKALKADGSGAEEDEASHRIDYLSNGFKMRYNWEGNNQSGASYIYMAFGQSIVGSNNIPCTAR